MKSTINISEIRSELERQKEFLKFSLGLINEESFLIITPNRQGILVLGNFYEDQENKPGQTVGSNIGFRFQRGLTVEGAKVFSNKNKLLEKLNTLKLHGFTSARAIPVRHWYEDKLQQVQNVLKSLEQ